MLDVNTVVGQISIEEDEILFFPEGLLGFSQFKKFVFVNDPSDDVFVWLQSCESKEVAFPVIEAGFITEVNSFDLNPVDRQKLVLEKDESPDYYCIVRISEEIQGMTANLKAPIVINQKDRLGFQFVMSNQKLQVQYPVFDVLKNKVGEDAELL
jgi:flagellar assembly factor FliW